MKFKSLIAILAILALVTAACGDAEEAPDTSAADAAAAEAAAAEAAAAEAAAAELRQDADVDMELIRRATTDFGSHDFIRELTEHVNTVLIPKKSLLTPPSK